MASNTPFEASFATLVHNNNIVAQKATVIHRMVVLSGAVLLLQPHSLKWEGLQVCFRLRESAFFAD